MGLGKARLQQIFFSICVSSLYSACEAEVEKTNIYTLIKQSFEELTRLLNAIVMECITTTGLKETI